jgi:hypothetical protein
VSNNTGSCGIWDLGCETSNVCGQNKCEHYDNFYEYDKCNTNDECLIDLCYGTNVCSQGDTCYVSNLQGVPPCQTDL